MRVVVRTGDISREPADALITAINSGGMWFGGIDGVIQRAAGRMFHNQAAVDMPLRDGQTVVAMGNGQPLNGAFQNVVFVVDDLQQRLREIIYRGLKAANEAGYRTVTLPTIRMGVMLGAVEHSVEEAVEEMVCGVARFMKNFPNSTIKTATFVVYNDLRTANLLERAFK